MVCSEIWLICHAMLKTKHGLPCRSLRSVARFYVKARFRSASYVAAAFALRCDPSEGWWSRRDFYHLMVDEPAIGVRARARAYSARFYYLFRPLKSVEGNWKPLKKPTGQLKLNPFQLLFNPFRFTLCQITIFSEEILWWMVPCPWDILLHTSPTW